MLSLCRPMLVDFISQRKSPMSTTMKVYSSHLHRTEINFHNLVQLLANLHHWSLWLPKDYFMPVSVNRAVLDHNTLLQHKPSAKWSIVLELPAGSKMMLLAPIVVPLNVVASTLKRLRTQPLKALSVPVLMVRPVICPIHPHWTAQETHHWSCRWSL